MAAEGCRGLGDYVSSRLESSFRLLDALQTDRATDGGVVSLQRRLRRAWVGDEEDVGRFRLEPSQASAHSSWVDDGR